MGQAATIYADAFFLDGEGLRERRENPTLGTPPKRMGLRPQHDLLRPWTGAPMVPRPLCRSRKFSSLLPKRWLEFIDNQAGEAALRKGYGKDDAVNGVLTAFWALAVRMSWDPNFNRVESKANISDAVSRADIEPAFRPGPSTWRWLDAATTSTMPSTRQPRTSRACPKLGLSRRSAGLEVCRAGSRRRPIPAPSLWG